MLLLKQDQTFEVFIDLIVPSRSFIQAVLDSHRIDASWFPDFGKF